MSGKRREPIRHGWFWTGVVLLVSAGSPWYLRPGSFEPIVFGLPYWVWISVGLSLFFCLYVRWACLRLWTVGDDQRSRSPRTRDGEGA